MGWRPAAARFPGWVARHQAAVAVTVGEIALLFAGAAASTAISVDLFSRWADLAQHSWGAIVIVVGTVEWSRGTPRIGQLITATGAAHYFQELRAFTNSVVFAVGFCLAYLWVATLCHLVLVWPDGRARGRPSAALIVTVYSVLLGTQVARFITDRPHPPWAYGIGQPDTAWAKKTGLVVIVLVLVTAGVVGRRWFTSTPVGRRLSAALWSAGIVTIALAVGFTTANLFEVPQVVQRHLELLALYSGLGIAGLAIFFHGRRAHHARSRIPELLDNEPALAQPGGLQEALAQALGDPTLRIGRLTDAGAYVDATGNALQDTDAAPGRTVTPVERHGRRLAIIDHDSALAQQENVARAAFALAALAVENDFLNAAHIRQIQDSRRRMERARIEERRRIARDLHDGAQHGLLTVLMRLDSARRQLTPLETSGAGGALGEVQHAHTQLNESFQALRDLVQGIYPAALKEQGLGAALEAIADQAPIPLTLDLPDVRWPEHVEVWAYFVIAEALANTYKHAQATCATVRAHHRADLVQVEITDDGRGGAVPGQGTGLRGMQDRIEAAGGALIIDSPVGHGTRISFHLPMEPQ